jgi:CheY-like chemotaxis protein
MLLKSLFRKVYCIDDNETDLFISEKYLKTFLVNPEVTLFTNGKEAMGKLLNLKHSRSSDFPDYILLDLHMPDMNGWDFLDEFYRQKIDLCCQSEFFILTSSVSHIDNNRSKQYPIVKNFISKPLNQNKFKETILRSFTNY